MLPVYAQDYLTQILDEIDNRSAIGRLSGWLEKHTTLAGRKFSFLQHEFQVDIIDSMHPNQGVIKPSQVGMSELTARLALAFLGVTQGAVAIYSLPTVDEAHRFSKSRIDPIIEGSNYLAKKMKAGSDSSGFKQVGTSQLFMIGTFGKAVISIPTDLLINDEYDFSNQSILRTAESRMSHSRFEFPELEMRGYRRKFSTPTVPGYGISAFFEKSNKKRRLVRCRHCTHWFWPSFLDHVVVQGWDVSIQEMTATDAQVLEARGLLPTAKLLCPHCRTAVRSEDLGPDNREWVAELPSVTAAEGLQVSPFDLPSYHNPLSLLRQMIEYGEETGHFRNFALGLPYADSKTSVDIKAVRDSDRIAPVAPGTPGIYGCVAGLDLGKTSWLTVGVPRMIDSWEGSATQMVVDVIWYEQIRVDEEEDNLLRTVEQRIREFGIVRLVSDAYPYTDTILRLKARYPSGVVMPCTYDLQDRKLGQFIVTAEGGVNANRTKTLDQMVRMTNNKRLLFSDAPDFELVLQHLANIKRLDRQVSNSANSSGTGAMWVNDGPDHYAHSLNYLSIAADLEGPTHRVIIPVRPSIVSAVVGRQYAGEEDKRVGRRLIA